MSSDSDSDICDFTSDIGKQMSKGLNQFWQNFNKNVDNEQQEQSLDINKVYLDKIDSSKEGVTRKLLSKREQNISKEDENIFKSDDISEKNIECTDTSVHNRITNKLNQLSEEIQTILKGKCNTAKKFKQKRSVRLQQKNKKKKPHIPAPSLNDNVVISSDEERSLVSSNIAHPEEINPVVTVNVLWKSIEKNSFRVHKFQTLSCISEHYSEKFNVKSQLLFFSLDDKQINLDESSFVSLRLEADKLIEGGILPESYIQISPPSTSLKDIRCELKFKVQLDDHKNNSIIVNCRKEDKMEIIFWQVSRHTKQPVENIKLYFDGCIVKPSNNISEMDIEEGDCFDLVLTNNATNTQ